MSNRSASLGRSARGWGGVVAGIFLLIAISTMPAVAVGIPQTQDYLSDPCFKDVSGRATAAGLSIPDTSLSNACISDHGNSDAAWAKLLILWKPRPGGDFDAPYVPPSVGPTWTMLLAGLAGIVLGYAVLGTPSRIMARLLAGSEANSLSSVAGSIVMLALRGAIAATLLIALSLPYAVMAGAILLLILLALGIPRRSRSGSTVAAGLEMALVRPSSIMIANLINDLWGGLAGLLVIAVVAQHDWRLVAAGVVLAIPASLNPIILARRSLRHNPVAIGIAAALLAACVGFVVVSDPQSGPGFLGGPWISGVIIVVVAVGVLGLNLKRPISA